MKVLANLLIIPTVILSCYIESKELNLLFLVVALIILINLRDSKNKS